MTKSLYNALKLIKDECERNKYCDSCPLYAGGDCIVHKTDPIHWDLDDIEISVRPKAKVCTCCIDYPNDAYDKRDHWKCKDYYECVRNKGYIDDGRAHRFVKTKCVLKNVCETCRHFCCTERDTQGRLMGICNLCKQDVDMYVSYGTRKYSSEYKNCSEWERAEEL